MSFARFRRNGSLETVAAVQRSLGRTPNDKEILTVSAWLLSQLHLVMLHLQSKQHPNYTPLNLLFTCPTTVICVSSICDIRISSGKEKEKGLLLGS
jgi:hypothetical protein